VEKEKDQSSKQSLSVNVLSDSKIPSLNSCHIHNKTETAAVSFSQSVVILCFFLNTSSVIALGSCVSELENTSFHWAHFCEILCFMVNLAFKAFFIIALYIIDI
jgi:hypothetical protein